MMIIIPPPPPYPHLFHTSLRCNNKLRGCSINNMLRVWQERRLLKARRNFRNAFCVAGWLGYAKEWKLKLVLNFNLNQLFIIIVSSLLFLRLIQTFGGMKMPFRQDKAMFSRICYCLRSCWDLCKCGLILKSQVFKNTTKS
jgi:hypothetical protein